MSSVRHNKQIVPEPWAYFASEVEQLADGLGKDIDNGIKPAVIALRAYGFPTNGSCEGHPKWGEQAPWVDIGHQPTKEEYVGSLKSGINKQLARRLLARNHPEQLRLFKLLDAYYRMRQNVPLLRRLIVISFGWYGNIRLTNQGADVQSALPPVERRQRLAQYRAEFQAFAAFLKHRWNEQLKKVTPARPSRSAPLPTNQHSHAR